MRHIVLLSVAGAQYEGVLFAKEFRLTEKHLEASGLQWATLRAAAFQENVLGAVQYVKQGIYGQPLGEDQVKGRFAPVAVSDIGTRSFSVLVLYYGCSFLVLLQAALLPSC